MRTLRNLVDCARLQAAIFVVLCAFVTLCLSVGFFTNSAAATELPSFEHDVAEQLRRPNVKFVVLTFSADWCGPCRQESQVWQKLKQRHAQDGVRFHVVRYKDGAAMLKPYHWPHRQTWDNEGRFGDALGVRDTLPKSFLWTWQGRLLVDGGSVKQVQRAIQRFLDRNPKVHVVAHAGKGRQSDEKLRMLTESEVLRLGKFEVVVRGADRKQLARLSKESHGLARAEAQHCTLGRQMSANALLEVRRVGGLLFISLKDVEKGCTIQTVSVDAGGGNLRAAIGEAMESLIEKLRSEPERPAGAEALETPKAAITAQSGEASAARQPKGLFSVRFDSVPSGEVWLNGVRICKRTPCSAMAAAGLAAVAMVARRYPPRKELVDLRPGGSIRWELGKRPTSQTTASASAGSHPTPSDSATHLVWVPATPDLVATRSEVTVAQYQLCSSAGACSSAKLNGYQWRNRRFMPSTACNVAQADRGDHPQNCVDWSQADKYCRWVGGRLPTAAEWTAAATNGGMTSWPWGERPPSCDVALLQAAADSTGAVDNGCQGAGSAKVCSRPGGTTKTGLCDMIGNVWEWTSSDQGEWKIVLGGGWLTTAKGISASKPATYLPQSRSHDMGFRCVRSTFGTGP